MGCLECLNRYTLSNPTDGRTDRQYRQGQSDSQYANESERKMAPDIIWASSSGIAFAITLLVLAVRFPRPTPFQLLVFRSVLALSAGSMAAAIPGFLQVEANAVGIAIRAGGALAVFLLVYRVNPAQLIQDGPESYDILSGLSTSQREPKKDVDGSPLGTVADGIAKSAQAVAAFTNALKDLEKLDPEKIKFLHNSSEMARLKGIIHQIIELQYLQSPLPGLLRYYAKSKTKDNWDQVARSIDHIAKLVRDLVETLSHFDGDFLIYRLKAYKALVSTVRSRKRIIDELEPMNVPRSKKDIANILRMADEYEILIRYLEQSEKDIAEYLRHQTGGSPKVPSSSNHLTEEE